MKLHILSPNPDVLTMGFVFVSDSGKTIVIDGGLDDPAGRDERYAGYLFQELQRITGKGRPYVDAWIFTHVHSDHMGEFCRMVETWNSEFGVRKFYFNFPSEDFAERHFNHIDKGWYRRFRNAYNAFFYDDMAFARHTPVCVGDRFELDGIEVEFLRVPNENIIQNPVNNTSIVFRVKAAGQTWLFLGDLGVEGGNELAAMYGDALKCDICQLAHHGQTGVGENVYDLAAPDFCICTAPKWSWENLGRGGPGTGPFRCAETMAMPSIARATTTVVYMDGTRELELPLKY